MLKEFQDVRKTWTVKIIERGASYGRENCLEHKGIDPLIEFREADYFVSRYYLSTLLAMPYGMGLCLEGSMPEYSVSGNTMAEVRNWLREEK